MGTIHDTFADAQLDATLQSRLVEDAEVPSAAVERYCSCAELLINGKRLPVMRYHDCDYIFARNKLIPSATRLANKRVTLTPHDDSTSANIKFTRLFSSAMDELALPLLRQRNGTADSSPDADEQTATDDNLGERVHKPREVMTVPLVG